MLVTSVVRGSRDMRSPGEAQRTQVAAGSSGSLVSDPAEKERGAAGGVRHPAAGAGRSRDRFVIGSGRQSREAIPRCFGGVNTNGVRNVVNPSSMGGNFQFRIWARAHSRSRSEANVSSAIDQETLLLSSARRGCQGCY